MAALLVGAGAAVYVVAGSTFNPVQSDDASKSLKALAVGPMAKLAVLTQPSGLPPSPFTGPSGAPVSLAAFKGQVVVLNLWATWCAPCIKEMPTLAALQGAYAGKPVKVVALSQDRAQEGDKARAFIAQHAPLDFFQDAKFVVAPEIKPAVAGFPTTVLYDKRGIARAMLSGEADWNGPQARAIVDRLLAE